MSKTTERLVAVTNELEDIVAHFEEKERPDAGWINEHWVEALTNIRNDGNWLWAFADDDNPTVVLHEVYMALKDTLDQVEELRDRVNHLRAEVNQRPVPEVNAHLQGLQRQVIDFNWPLNNPQMGVTQLNDFTEFNMDDLTIRGTDVT